MLKKIIIAFFIRGLGAVAAFFMTVVVARQLTSSEAGYYFLAFTVLSIIAPINLFGTDVISLRFIGSASAENEWDKVNGFAVCTVLIVVFFSLFSSSLLYFFSSFFAEHIWDKPDMTQILKKTSVVIFFTSLSMLFAFHLQAIQRVIESVVVMTIVTPVTISFFILFDSLNSASLVFSYLIGVSVFNFIIGLLFWSKHGVKFHPKLALKLPSIKNIYSICLPLWVGAILGVSTSLGSQLIAAIWVSASDIAYLSAAQRTAGLVSFILIAVNMIVAPKFSALHKKGSYLELRELALKSARISTSIAAPLVLVLLFFSDAIMVLFGSDFVLGTTSLIILTLGQFINVLTGSVSYLLTMSGYEKDVRNVVLVSCPVTLVLALVLTPSFGISGAAFSTMIGISIQNLGAVWFVKKRLGFNMLAIWQKI